MLRNPRSIGQYRLLRRLGAGGMGEVFLGISPSGRPVAVKVVQEQLVRMPQVMDRFRREVLANRLVSGAFTAPVIDADTYASPPWLVTSYIPGPSLQQSIDHSGALPARTVLALAAGLAEALDSIHDARLVHRDLKPSNVLLAEDGPRVIDFGIARITDATRITLTGAPPGTPGFMSPEQLTGTEITEASDVFSLGTLLAYAATGTKPFGSNWPAVDYQIVYGEADLDGLLDPALRALVSDCLAKAPGRRPTPQEIIARAGFSDDLTTLLGVDSWSPAAGRVRTHEETVHVAETLSRYTAEVTRGGAGAAPDAGGAEPGERATLLLGPRPRPRQDGQGEPPRHTRRTVLLAALGTAALAGGASAGIHFARDEGGKSSHGAPASRPSDDGTQAGSPASPARDRVPGLIGAWPLDTAHHAADTVGHHDGTWSAVGWGAGRGGAAQFDGRESLVVTGGPVIEDTGENSTYSVAARVLLDRVPETGFATVVSQASGHSSAFYLQCMWTETTQYWALAGPVNNDRVYSIGQFVLEKWTHLVGVRDGDTMHLYVDGKPQGEGARTTDVGPGGEAGPLAIGCARFKNEHVDWFPGSIADVQVFNRVLTPAEAGALHKGART